MDGVIRYPGGLHGVGVSVVNALSEWLVVHVKRDRKYIQAAVRKDNTVSELEIIANSDGTGTSITLNRIL